MKTRVRPSLRAFFYRRPLDPLPTADLGLVALNRAALRALATEPVVAQQSPDMAGMILDPGQILDEGCHTRKRPQVGLVASAHRPFDKCLHDQLGLKSSQLGLAARLSLAGQAGLAALLPRRLPTVGHLTAHPEPPPDFRGRGSLLEHRSSLNPPLLHPCMISRQRHARSLHRRYNMSPYYASLNRLFPTPPLGDAVTFSYTVPCQHRTRSFTG
jgi:hypothetical protein